jgi:hypothetical protein
MPYPELLKTLCTSSAIPKMGIPKAPVRLVSRLFCAGERVDESKLLQRKVKMPAKIVQV